MSVEIKYTQHFINNEFVDSISGKKRTTYNPATEEKIIEVAEGDHADIDRAVTAARKAFEIGSEWRSMDASARGALVLKFSQLIRRDLDYLTQLESLNNGKPLKEARDDIEFGVKTLEYYAGWADKVSGKTIPADGPVFTFTKHEPVGVCGQLIPWAYPVLMLTWKLGMALTTGNTVVMKPAEETPLTALYCAALIKEAGFPAGVVNIVLGDGPVAGAALALHHDVDKIAFTGTERVGHLIQEMSAKSNLKRVNLELGGKSPFIIFDINENDLKKAAGDATFSMYTNQGQSCCASSSIFVHESVYERFIEISKEMAEALVVGDPFAAGTTQGSLISQENFGKVLEYIESGKKEGARLVCGGKRVGSKGFFVEPTIFADVTDDMKIATDEILGPVMSIFKFKTVEEVIERANKTKYGLAAGVWSNDITTVMKVTNALQAGSVWVNCFEIVVPQAPFGGFKQSGFGRELGEYGLHEYLEVKTVTIKYN